jgi:hypothetical protein
MDTSLLVRRIWRQIQLSTASKKVSAMEVTLIGIDLAKSVFQVCGVGRSGNRVMNRAIRRQQVLAFLSRYPRARSGRRFAMRMRDLLSGRPDEIQHGSINNSATCRMVK